MSLGYSGDYITIAGTTIKIESIDAAWYSCKDDTNFVCFIINGSPLNIQVDSNSLDEIKVQLDQLFNSRQIV